MPRSPSNATPKPPTNNGLNKSSAGGGTLWKEIDSTLVHYLCLFLSIVLNMALSEHFSIKNIPYGIATSDGHSQKVVATRIHDHVIFLNDLGLTVAEEIKQAIDQVRSLNSESLLSR